MLANFALLVLALGTVGLTGQIRRVPPGFLHPLFLAAGWMSLALLTLGAAVLITWPDSTNGLEGWLILFGLLAFVLLATWL